MKSPLIGIVATQESVEKGMGRKSIQFLNQDYIDALSRFNASAVIITLDAIVTDRLADVLDGLLLVGGEDIAEECYLENHLRRNKRDLLEIELYDKFKIYNKPILGICRGMQLINVAEGGTLKNINTSIVEHTIGKDGWINYHDIAINNESKIYELIKRENYTVASVHHQQIDKLGDELTIAAISKDGIIEAIENRKYNFIVGFQGHIEKCLNNYSKYEKIFEKFIKETYYNGKEI